MKSLMKMLEQLELHEGDLNDWERSFVDRMRNIVDRHGSTTALTAGQAEMIERIYRDRVEA